MGDVEKVKKGKGMKVVLIVVSTFLVISIITNFYLYTRQYGDDLQNQVSSLQNEVADLRSAKLIAVNLDGTDNRSGLETPYLHVTGEVVNVGSYAAHNCKLHVILYQGEAVAKDTYIDLGTIYGSIPPIGIVYDPRNPQQAPSWEIWKTVDSKIYYEGEALTTYEATLEWE